MRLLCVAAVVLRGVGLRLLIEVAGVLLYAGIVPAHCRVDVLLPGRLLERCAHNLATYLARQTAS